MRVSGFKVILFAMIVGFLILQGCAGNKVAIRNLPQELSVESVTEDKDKQEIIRQLIDKEAEKKAKKIVQQRLKEIETQHNLAVLRLERERNRTFRKILKASPTPLKVPDTVIRVLLLPYVDSSGTLHQYTYLYLKVDEGKWILGDYLLKPIKFSKDTEQKRKKIVHPLKGGKK